MQRKQLAVFAGDPDCGSDAAPIMIRIFRILCHGTERHLITGKSGRVGEAERNALDRTKIHSPDSGWGEGNGIRTSQSIEKLEKRVTDNRVVDMPLVAALKQKQLIAAPAKTPLPAEYEINAVVVKGLGV